MTSLMQLDLVDSEKQIFSGDVEFLVAPAVEGELGIYPHHVALIAKLKAGVLRVKLPQHETHLVFAISGGFLEISDNHATVLADIVERTETLDELRLLEQKTEAIAKVKHTNSSSTTLDVARAQVSLDIAIAQLKALEYLKKFANKQ